MRVLGSLRSLTRAICAGTVALVLVAGCSSSGGAGWTYAPQPSITPPPSASASPSASATATASAAPSNPGGSGSPGGGAVIKEAALGVAFVNGQLEAPAGQPFTIDFDNQDAGIPHNIQIKDANGASVFKGDIVTGPIQTSYQVGALAAGTYPFICDVHPTSMTGTLTVK
jgi:plastocyanin